MVRLRESVSLLTICHWNLERGALRGSSFLLLRGQLDCLFDLSYHSRFIDYYIKNLSNSITFKYFSIRRRSSRIQSILEIGL